MKIYVRRVDKEIHFPKVFKKGDWIDLRCAEDVVMKAPQAGVLKYKTENNQKIGYRNVTFDAQLISLGVAMKLPKGYEAELKPRSSMTKNHKILFATSGVIDNSYCGNNDIWKLYVVALDDVDVERNTRIAQFRIHLSQKATVWQKIKWLFTNKIELIEVDDLGEENRNGFGEGTKDLK